MSSGPTIFRLNDLKKDPRLKYVLVFKNEGEVAGSSLEHSHSQLIALPIVPNTVREEMDNARKYYDAKERCLFCDIVNQELDSGKRLVYENERYVAIAPFAPREPFETWILPKKHESAFVPPDKSFGSLAEIPSARFVSSTRYSTRRRTILSCIPRRSRMKSTTSFTGTLRSSQS